MHVINYPHPTLRHPSKPLKRVDAELRAIVRQMFELMYDHKGVGLAANQVDLPYRLFITNTQSDPDAKEEERVFINPVLSGAKGSVEGEEGCLSIPNVYGDVVRAERIKVNAYTLDGEEVEEEVSDLLARVIQHETDHLDGRLFIDRLTPTSEIAIRDALEELEIEFRNKREIGAIPSDDEVAARLAALEKQRT
jgi:peptide deformylase